MPSILDKAKTAFTQMVKSGPNDPFRLLTHLGEVERWAKFMIEKKPDLDEEILLLGAWLHDFGHYPIQKEIDHAVIGEQRARKFLEEENYPEDRMNRVLHCIRSHRCRDVKPESLEAKTLAACDSASHMTDLVYADMITRGDPKNEVLEKIKRDYRDIKSMPEIMEELEPVYNAWKNLIEVFPEK